MPDLQKLSENSVQKSSSGSFSLVPTSLEEAWKLAQYMAESDLVPKDYRGKPQNVLVAVQMGLEIGLQPMQAVQNISVINGRPSVWGDAVLALCRDKDVFDNGAFKEWFEGELPNDDFTAYCQAKRTDGGEPHVQSFSVRDAKRAKLWTKNTYKQYPKRMLQMRARSWALRDTFPDVLKGINVAEEAQDIPAEPVRAQDAVVIEEEPVEQTQTASVKEKLSEQLADEEEAAGEPATEASEEPVEPDDFAAGVNHYREQVKQADSREAVDEAFDAAKDMASEWPKKFRDTLMDNLDKECVLWQERRNGGGDLFDE